ncbi:MAG: hypothetical protein GX616_04675, partial [Planctomycetes bacterium]|nr:hypothetical protein [Planctomycetota bacterium]
MGDESRQFSPGERWQPSAAFLNDTAEAIRYAKTQSAGGGALTRGLPAQGLGSIVLVTNSGGEDWPAWSPVELTHPAGSPVAKIAQFAARPYLCGDTPDDPVGATAVIGITQEPIPAGAMGRVCIGGLTLALVVYESEHVGDPCVAVEWADTRLTLVRRATGHATYVLEVDDAAYQDGTYNDQRLALIDLRQRVRAVMGTVTSGEIYPVVTGEYGEGHLVTVALDDDTTITAGTDGFTPGLLVRPGGTGIAVPMHDGTWQLVSCSNVLGVPVFYGMFIDAALQFDAGAEHAVSFQVWEIDDISGKWQTTGIYLSNVQPPFNMCGGGILPFCMCQVAVRNGVYRVVDFPKSFFGDLTTTLDGRSGYFEALGEAELEVQIGGGTYSTVQFRKIRALPWMTQPIYAGTRVRVRYMEY